MIQSFWENVFAKKWLCRVDRLNANNGLLIVCCLPGQRDFEPRGLVTPVCLAYGTGSEPDPDDIYRWREIVVNFVDQKAGFTLQ